MKHERMESLARALAGTAVADDRLTGSRREFLKGSAITVAGTAGGLTLGVPLDSMAQAGGPGKAGQAMSREGFAPNAFIRIGTDNTVTVLSKHLEMGQGSYTGLATLAAEELDADWSQIRVDGAPADARTYNNLFWGPAQGTGGSTAIANSFAQMRKAGASARAMLVAAAAEQWKVPAAEIRVAKGVVSHASGRRATFGQLAQAAARQQVPADVTLKDPAQFSLIGKEPGKGGARRVDSVGKTTGTAQFTLDVQLPGMLTAVVAHPPRFGARPARWDDSATRAVKGVVDVVQIPGGVAVLANGFWPAHQGRAALKVDWDESAAYWASSSDIANAYKLLALQAGDVARNDGSVDTGMSQASKTVEGEFEFPFLAHAAMEPLNCVVHFTGQAVEVWNGEQLHTGDQWALAQVFGLKPEQVRIHTLFAGGGFGRRASKDSDYVVEAALIAKALAAKGRQVPVKLQWTREDDMRAGYYRPMYVHTIRAGIDDKGQALAWQHRIVGQSILVGTVFEPMLVKNGIDATSVEGASTLPYEIPNLQVDLHTTNKTVAVPTLWWRSVGSTHTAFSTEVMIDELARAAGQDPVAYRRALLKRHPRHLGVLELTAEKAGWGRPLPAGRFRGVAVHESFNTFVAQVAEVSVAADQKSFRVERVVCAVDCGLAVNPDVIRAQVEGSVGFALSAALYGRITLKDGVVEQSNFHDYPVLRINEMPKVETWIVPSVAAPSGIGEPAVPPLAPAVANALAQATGRKFRSLPLSLA